MPSVMIKSRIKICRMVRDSYPQRHRRAHTRVRPYECAPAKHDILHSVEMHPIIGRFIFALPQL